MKNFEFLFIYGLLLIQLTIVIYNLIKFPKAQVWQIFAIFIGLGSAAALLAGLIEVFQR